ncbi:(d)CMP kinase [Sporosarcina sp. HYO08]|uniref:(d)CMP kinase n=1 Tax=Sporosarcina sp. HYO08 TaxID=1759557 RepID=UPI00079A3E58|nr:(d)CMP kinase [Sporosarcina sp. HYO08]KXH82036.1 cytidylate kinase [Sporosarcina sp. HYO08]
MSKGIQIAIDGPAAAGKSTIAKITAEKLGFTYIDTGAMYRALTHKALLENIDTTNGEQMANLLLKTEIVLHPSQDGQRVVLDGQDVSEAIRSREVTEKVSLVASHNGVRKQMVENQRLLAAQTNVVMDGRDIGTDVLPNADLKVFMTATAEERAKRRFLENEKRGISTPLEQLTAEIIKRDQIDSERAVSPLRQAADAIRIDTTFMTIEEVAERIKELAEERVRR